MHSEFRNGLIPLLSATLGISVGITALYFYTFGLFIKPLQMEFGWSRSAISAVAMAGGLTLTVLSPLVGKWADKWGTLRVALPSMLGFAVGFWLLSLTPQYYAVYLGFIIAIHILGAGTTPVTFTRLVNLYFIKHRGIALGISLLGTGLTASLAPYLVSSYMTDMGWRASYQMLALTALVFFPIVAALLYFSGRQTPPKLSAMPVSTQAENTSVVNLLRERRELQLLVVVFLLISVSLGGLVVHLVPIVTDAGFTPKQASLVAGLLGGAVILGRLLCGYLFDRFFAPNVARIVFCISAVGCLLLTLESYTMLLIGGLILGLSLGAEVDLISYLVARYFGMQIYGKVYGFLYSIFMLGMSTSPLYIGSLFDANGNYQLALYCSGAGVLGAAITLSLLPKFNYH